MSVNLKAMKAELLAAGFELEESDLGLLVYDNRPSRSQDCVFAHWTGAVESDSEDHPALDIIRKHVDAS